VEVWQLTILLQILILENMSELLLIEK